MTYGDWNHDGDLSQTEAWGTMIQTGYLDDCDVEDAKAEAHATVPQEPSSGQSIRSRMPFYWKTLLVLTGFIVACIVLFSIYWCLIDLLA